MAYLIPFDVFDSVAVLGLLHTYSVPTYAHGVCVYIVIDGKRKGEGEGWRDRSRESKRVRGRFKSVFHGWLCCYGNKMWAPYSQKSVLLPSSLPSLFPSFCISSLHFFLFFFTASTASTSLSPLPYPPITSHHMPPPSLSSAHPLLSSIFSPPTHSPLSLCPFSPSLLFHASTFFLSVLPSLSLSLSIPLFPCLSDPSVSLTLTYILFFSRLSWQ